MAIKWKGVTAMEPKFLLVTDGSAVKQKEGNIFDGAYGFHAYEIVGENQYEKLHQHGAYANPTTVPRMEMTAILKALEYIQAYIKVSGLRTADIYILTDSELSFKSLTEWAYSWLKKEKGGKIYNSSKKEVLNQDVILMAFRIILDLKRIGYVRFLHINSHVMSNMVSKAKERFEDYNNIDVSDETFIKFLEFNESIDEFVSEIYNEAKEE